jgi:hypothetical protein
LVLQIEYKYLSGILLFAKMHLDIMSAGDTVHLLLARVL